MEIPDPLDTACEHPGLKPGRAASQLDAVPNYALVLICIPA